MPRSRSKSGKQRERRVEEQAVAARGHFNDVYQFACWWWRLVVNSWDEEERLTGDVSSTQEVLEMALRIDGGTGEYALGTRGPRLGDDRAPWRCYPSLELVRRRGLYLQPPVGPGFEVVPWPRPPPGFAGGLAQRLPPSGVDLCIKPVAGDQLRLHIHVFSVVGHDMLTPDVISWGWSGGGGSGGGGGGDDGGDDAGSGIGRGGGDSGGGARWRCDGRTGEIRWRDHVCMFARLRVGPVCFMSVCRVSAQTECLPGLPVPRCGVPSGRSWRYKPCGCHRRCGLVTSRTLCGE